MYRKEYPRRIFRDRQQRRKPDIRNQAVGQIFQDSLRHDRKSTNRTNLKG
jgi:hypothetical protein